MSSHMWSWETLEQFSAFSPQTGNSASVIKELGYPHFPEGACLFWEMSDEARNLNFEMEGGFFTKWKQPYLF